MAITIKIYNKKWQIHIDSEIWQFDNKEQFVEVLEYLLMIKEKYGRFKEF